ncbi:metallophosphoesterase [uncultured Gemella sp.]|uniref:metallophosphoesterase n=1 Tax=uncultured Gemella sp. TaxID=254352 RepID=UPI0025CECCEE|nr:metallophosphoesterase [uncultured Gemella sp.]
MNRKLLALAPIIAASSIIRQNKKLKVRKTTLKFDKLPQAFDNFKIAQVSDIHCDRVGHSDLSFIKKIKDFNPDIIVITGDVLDSYNNDMDIAYNILSQLAIIAPCYFVSGNHELRLPEEYEQLINIMKKLNITYMNNSNLLITKNNESINLVGVEDYNFFKNEDNLNHRANFIETLKELYSPDHFNILLSHRPEKFPIYADLKYELIFSGHAHGGQWRVPFIGGIFSPSQGFFPKYTNGNYVLEDSTIIVSQGLGNSSFPIRINNRIELVLATLKK